MDVAPDGFAQNLTEGIIRARYRNSQAKLALMKPAELYRFTIDLWSTSNVFLKGHRLRIEVSSSNFPKYDRNPNTGHKFGEDAELLVAHQKVYHDAAHSSYIALPIIPAGGRPCEGRSNSSTQ